MQEKGFLRVAAAVPMVKVADINSNIDSIYNLLLCLDKEGVELAVFPEMSLTAYTCGDLFHNETLLDACEDGLYRLLESSKELNLTFAVGLPVRNGNTLYNCAAICCRGQLLALVPKTYIPNYNEFYEKRWWSPAPTEDIQLSYAGYNVNLSSRQIIEVAGAKVSIEICEDMWTPVAPSSYAALAGADVILNLSASDTLIGKHKYQQQLVVGTSAKLLCAYVYASAGFGESSTDLVFDGPAYIAEKGSLLAGNTRWTIDEHYIVADIDLDAIAHDRIRMSSYQDCASRLGIDKIDYITIQSATIATEKEKLIRNISPTPFVPKDRKHLADRCDEITDIQVAGLAKRLVATGCKHIVVGISGGLDSTLALLVAARTFDRLGINRKNIVAVTMPGFGTTGRTYNNAMTLMKELGVTIREISIIKAVEQHFADIGHDISVHDVTYENSQARMRTMLLMDIANQCGGMVLGTGDLSELALGWATYNGDHMSMYGVNASVPKTLVRFLVASFAKIDSEEYKTALASALKDIVDTPVSPELIPADDKGNIVQKTEDLVGPYELHDFFLYYMLRYGFSPRRIFRLAKQAFDGAYDDKTISKWLTTFIRRFFSQQFKRSCLPDGPKVGSICLSPRGDWRMPSDACAALWLEECKSL